MPGAGFTAVCVQWAVCEGLLEGGEKATRYPESWGSGEMIIVKS